MYINPNYKIQEGAYHRFQSCLEELLRFGTLRSVSAGEHILTQGDACDYLFYVKQGKFRTLRFIGEKEVILGFTFEGDLDTCPHAFLNKTPSQDTIQAITDSEVVRIHRQYFDSLAKTHPEFKDFMIYLLSEYVETLVERFVEFKAETAEKRYLQLLKRQPRQAKSIPVQDLASYLGISRERLSRIRKKYPELI